MNWPLLQNSLLVGALTTTFAVTIGFVAALWLAALSPRWRRLLFVIAVVALALPPFLVTNCWLHYLGFTGVWRGWLPLNLYSLTGAVWILTLMLWPIPMLLTLAAWERLEPAQLEVDPALTGGALIRWLLWPTARPALAQGAVLTFVLALNHFAVPSLLQVKVYPVEVWLNFNTKFDPVGALRLSWPLIAAPLLLLFWFRHREVAWPRIQGTVAPNLIRRQLGPGWFSTGALISVVVVILAAGLPLLELCLNARTWHELLPALSAGQGALWNSFVFATVAATLVVAISLCTWRWPLGTVLWVPFLVPGVLTGIVLILVFDRPVLDAFYRTAGIVFLAWTIRYLAIGWNVAADAIRSVDPDLTDAARIEGASGWQLFRLVHWPQIAARIAAAWYVVYLLCLWDVETLVLIQPPGGETLAVRIFGFLHYGHNPQVNALCLVLLGLAMMPLVLWRISQGIATFIKRHSNTAGGATEHYCLETG